MFFILLPPEKGLLIPKNISNISLLHLSIRIETIPNCTYLSTKLHHFRTLKIGSFHQLQLDHVSKVNWIYSPKENLNFFLITSKHIPLQLILLVCMELQFSFSSSHLAFGNCTLLLSLVNFANALQIIGDDNCRLIHWIKLANYSTRFQG